MGKCLESISHPIPQSLCERLIHCLASRFSSVKALAPQSCGLLPQRKNQQSVAGEVQQIVCQACKGKKGGEKQAALKNGIPLAHGCRYSGIHETLFVRGFAPNEA